MGKSIDKPVIIEFNGLPGSGKTTIALQLYEELIKYGNHVLDFNEYFFKNKRNKILIIKALFQIRGIHVRYLLKILGLIQIRNKIELKKVKMVISAFLHFLIYNYCVKIGNYQYIILDQGIVQNWVSFFYDTLISDTKTVKEIYQDIFKSYPYFYMINSEVNTETILSRLKYREHGTSRLDRLCDKDLGNIIEIQRNNFYTMRKTNEILKSVEIDTKQDPIVNVKKIINFCYKECMEEGIS